MVDWRIRWRSSEGVKFMNVQADTYEQAEVAFYNSILSRGEQFGSIIRIDPAESV